MHLEPWLLERLEGEASRAAPLECCGLLWAGENGEVRRFTPYPGPLFRHRFVMADEWLLEQCYQGRARGERLAGYYHSHPDSAPDPSPADLQGHPPGANCLILGAGGTYKIVRLLEIPPEDRTDGGQVLVDHR